MFDKTRVGYQHVAPTELSEVKPVGLFPISIHSRWILISKELSIDEKPKLKARIVARGDKQVAGIDYSATFTPVVRWSAIRIILALAANRT